MEIKTKPTSQISIPISILKYRLLISTLLGL
jgi:hypothetical protein